MDNKCLFDFKHLPGLSDMCPYFLIWSSIQGQWLVVVTQMYNTFGSFEHLMWKHCKFTKFKEKQKLYSEQTGGLKPLGPRRLAGERDPVKRSGPHRHLSYCDTVISVWCEVIVLWSKMYTGRIQPSRTPGPDLLWSVWLGGFSMGVS